MPARGNDDEGHGRPELGPLPAGHHGLSREQVAESQRERLLAAVAEVVAERGYGSTTITDIVKAASVSSRVFYENFESKEDAFLAAFDAVRAHFEELLAEAVRGQPDWPRQVVAALRQGLRFLEEEPQLGRFALVEPTSASPVMIRRFREAVLGAVPFLERGRIERADAASLPESTEDSILGGLIVLVSGSLQSGARPLAAILPDLVNFVLAPYLGPDEARRLGSEAAAG